MAAARHTIANISDAPPLLMLVDAASHAFRAFADAALMSLFSPR